MNHAANNVAARCRTRGRGFSFVEVLFAVMILGIGFIMVAAMFPATIRQTATTMEETVGANIANGALQYLQSAARDDLMPVVSGTVVSQPGVLTSLQLAPASTTAVAGSPTTIYAATKGNFIFSQDPRYAWTALYRRELIPTAAVPTGVPADYAQVFIIVAQCRNRPQYYTREAAAALGLTWNDVDRPAGAGAPAEATLEAKLVNVTVQYNSTLRRSELTFNSGTNYAAPGAYVIIANDSSAGRSNGRIYQLGNAIDQAGGLWELAPGGDMMVNATTYADNNLSNRPAYILGRGFLDPTASNYNPGGPAQDIGVYTGFIRIIK